VKRGQAPNKARGPDFLGKEVNGAMNAHHHKAHSKFGGGGDLRKWKIMQDSHPDAHKTSFAVPKLDQLRIHKH